MDAISLDVHAHLLPVRVRAHVAAMASLFDPGALLRWMDAHRIARAWVSVPPPAYRPHLSEADALRWARHLNDGLREMAMQSGARLQALLHLPLDHPSAALAVLASRGRGDAAIAGYAASTTLHEGTLADATLNPVWAALDAQRAFLFLHPGDCADPRLGRFYLQNLLGNPHETAVAAGALVFGGVLERHARMQVCLAHGGGTVPAVAGRWQRGFDTARPGVNPNLEAPRTALQRLWVDCITHDPAALQCACATFGEHRMLFGSDWPFPMGVTDPERQCRMLSENVRALLDLVT